MDKQELLRAMDTALKSTKQRDDVYRKYMREVALVNEAQEKLESFPILARIKLSIIPFGLMCVFGPLYEVTQTNLFINIARACFILLIVVNVVGKYIYFFTGDFKRKTAKNDEKREELRNEYVPQLIKHMEDCKAALPQLGDKYHTTHALEHMIDYLQNGRAETIKDLIEVYELDCHRMRMEESQNRVLAEMAAMQAEINQLSSQLNYVTYYKQ